MLGPHTLDLLWCERIRVLALFRRWSQGILLLAAKGIFSAPCHLAVCNAQRGSEVPFPRWPALDIQTGRTVAKPLGTRPGLTTCSQLFGSSTFFPVFLKPDNSSLSTAGLWPGPSHPTDINAARLMGQGDGEPGLGRPQPRILPLLSLIFSFSPHRDLNHFAALRLQVSEHKGPQR